ncbi:MAG: hypothetical protein C4554_07090 [Dethiobacter sp.]|nr:MAG: hypothetical protein C4554_07090 [Dethiobacter sp.]
MREGKNKMMLSAANIESAQKAHSIAADDFLDTAHRRANVIGMGVGMKWKNAQPTGEPALVVLVTHKKAREELCSSDLIPEKLAGMQIDVLAIGYPLAGGGEIMENPAQTLARQIRPVKGGFSVGHKNITAGTIATCIYNILPENSTSAHNYGTGIPGRYYILSNNHVLANSNLAAPGDPILQPGPFDGGMYPRDRIATLSRFVPITFEPPVPREKHHNLVDAAIAEGEFHNLNREIYWIGHVRGWRPKNEITVGIYVQKTGRTTNYSVGRITAINATVDISYDAGRTARFKDQIITTNISAGGDSGSLVTTLDNVAIGLLFAGSSIATIVNQIENVRSLLQVEIAEEIL